jgi:glutathione synthase
MDKRHVILIDRLEKLTIKKDSTLLFAHSLKSLGKDVLLLFEDDFYLTNHQAPHYRLYDFDSALEEDGFYLKKFSLSGQKVSQIGNQDLVHMRLDPPFDSRYLRICWMLKSLKKFGVDVLNSPEGIILHNEKLLAYEQEEGSLESFIGSSQLDFLSFATRQKDLGVKSLILKPLDLFQGIGVEKIELDDLDKAKSDFKKKTLEFTGAVVAQPFVESISEGEIRSIYFKGVELGSIIKTPPKGSYLANIVQGAKFQKIDLNTTQRSRADQVCHELMKFGVDWVAFDILEDSLSEVNITCPGLLVEVSKAHNKNLALEIAKSI